MKLGFYLLDRGHGIEAIVRHIGEHDHGLVCCEAQRGQERCPEQLVFKAIHVPTLTQMRSRRTKLEGFSAASVSG